MELVKFHSPVDGNGVQPSFSNTLGIRHVCFAVDDVEKRSAAQKRPLPHPFQAIVQPVGEVGPKVRIRRGIVVRVATEGPFIKTAPCSVASPLLLDYNQAG